MNLDVSKSFQDTNNPTKIINENAHIFASFLKPRFNKSETNSEIPSVSKKANITPVYKKWERYSDDNYRSIWTMHVSPNKWIYGCILSRHRCGFRKGYSTQQWQGTNKLVAPTNRPFEKSIRRKN